jgi:predicted aspartyl protease
MRRIVIPVTIRNALDPAKEIRCDALVDTGAWGLILPAAWKERLGSLTHVRTVELEAADQRVVEADGCGPVEITIDGFDTIFNEATFLEMSLRNGEYEPLLGYVILEQSRAAVDMAGHRLVHVQYMDLK